MAVSLNQLLKILVERGGTELFLFVNSPPQLRIDGVLVPLDMVPLDEPEVLQFAVASGSAEQFAARLRQAGSLVHRFDVTGLGRFVMTVMRDGEGVASIIVKSVSYEIFGFKELGLPDFAFVTGPGLYLIGGLSRSGRSTVAAAVIDKHNRERHEAIVVVTADPQHLYPHKNSLVITLSASDETLMMLSSPQVTSLFDLAAFDGRDDQAAVELAFTLCDRGLSVVLVSFGKDSVSLIKHLVDLFPPSSHATVVARLAERFQWALTVTRIPHSTGRGFVSIFEFLFGTSDVRQMLSAGRYDNVGRILTQDDPYTPHQALVNSARMVVARRRVSKQAVEIATGLQL